MTCFLGQSLNGRVTYFLGRSSLFVHVPAKRLYAAFFQFELRKTLFRREILLQECVQYGNREHLYGLE